MLHIFQLCGMINEMERHNINVRKRIEVVITALTRNQVVLTGSWVRIPPLPPENDRFRRESVVFSYIRPMASHIVCTGLKHLFYSRQRKSVVCLCCNRDKYSLT